MKYSRMGSFTNKRNVIPIVVEIVNANVREPAWSGKGALLWVADF